MLVMPHGAKRISSRMTGFYKRVFPVLWFGFLGLFMLIGLTATRAGMLMALPFILVPLVLGGIGYLIMRLLLNDLMDEVWDNGRELIVVNEGHVEHEPLKEIVNISYSGFTNPKRATLMLRRPGRWGAKLTFMPVRSSISLWKLIDNEMIDELIRRADEARREA